MNFGIEWTSIEEAVVSTHYGTLTKTELMVMLPGRTWRTIQRRASLLGRAGQKFQGPNRHETHGEIATIFLEQRDGSVFECQISAHRIERILTFGRWHVSFANGKPYVRSGSEATMLHRFIMNCPDGQDVDHRDDNGLNNVDDNL